MGRAVEHKERESARSTKARILAAAEEIFAARGFDGASTREIAARAEVNISSLHYHWESKEALYLAVYRNIYHRLHAVMQDELAPLLADRRPRDEVVNRLAEVIFTFFGQQPALPRLLLRWIVDEESIGLGPDSDVLARAWTGSLAWLTSERPMPEQDAKLFVLTMHSVSMMYLLDSQSYRRFLGGSVRDEPFAGALREHMAALMQRLLPH